MVQPLTHASDRRRYVQTSFATEASLFSVLESNRDALLGEDSLWLPRGWLFGRGATGDLADAYALDLEEGAWWMVQAELGRTPFWSEVVPRVSRRLAALQHGMFRLWLAETSLAAALGREGARSRSWNPLRVSRQVRAILDTPPRLALVMDADLPVVRDWSATLRFETRLLEITRHRSQSDPTDVCYRIPLHGAGHSTISGLEPADDALPASRFVLVHQKEASAQAWTETAAFLRASA